MEISSLILIIISILEFIFGIYILSINLNDEIRRAYAFFTFSVVLWVLTNIPQQLISEKFTEIFLGKMAYLAAAFVASSFLYFVWVFPYKTFTLNIWHKLLITLVPLTIGFISIFTNLIVVKFVYTQTNKPLLELGSIYNFYVLYFLGYWIWALVLLVMKYRKSDGIHRWQLKYLLWGIFISLIGGTTTNLFLPWFGFMNYGWIGPITTVIWFGFTYYVIFGKSNKDLA